MECGKEIKLSTGVYTIILEPIFLKQNCVRNVTINYLTI